MQCTHNVCTQHLSSKKVIIFVKNWGKTIKACFDRAELLTFLHTHTCMHVHHELSLSLSLSFSLSLFLSFQIHSLCMLMHASSNNINTHAMGSTHVCTYAHTHTHTHTHTHKHSSMYTHLAARIDKHHHTLWLAKLQCPVCHWVHVAL